MKARWRRHLAFTLIELVVVIGIIALAAGLWGIALRGNNPTATLQSAQSALGGMLAAARAQAALDQVRTVVAIDANSSSDAFLRSIRVATEILPNSNAWTPVGIPVVLPSGVYVVPNPASVTGAVFSNGANGGVPWPPTRHSSIVAGNVSGAVAGRYLIMMSPMTPVGTLDGAASEKLVLAAGRRTATGVVFDNPELVRGAVVSAYGAVTFINDGHGFDF